MRHILPILQMPKLGIRHLFVVLSMATAATLGSLLKPEAIPQSQHLDLERLIPKEFDGWTIDSSMVPVLPSPDRQQMLNETYDQLVNRTYMDSSKRRIMVSIAYGSRQTQSLKAHRQEVCYASQGFQIRNLKHEQVKVAGKDITVTRMFATAKERQEPVTYWFTVGDRVVQSHLERLVAQIRFGLSGTIPDGVLVRVSSLSSDPERAYGEQLDFINVLVTQIPAEHRSHFVGNLDSR